MKKFGFVRVSVFAMLLVALALQIGFVPRTQAEPQNKVNGLERIARSVTIYRPAIEALFRSS